MNALTGIEIRQKFSQYFIDNRHQKIPSSSLIPHNDKSLLFCNAGMNQFKDYFTGKEKAQNPRAVSIQKCVRAGGKHNDLENVGHTARHHTFFEMLGNFSFGDYFKAEAIKLAWNFLTIELKIPKDRLYVTVHYSDEEAIQIWNQQMEVPLDRIFKKGDKDNFWEMGEFGPCGPCSEIFFDHGEQYADPELKSKVLNDLLEDEKRYIEIWNLVFMQFEKTPEGKFPLPRPSIDTGAGLERLAAALQNCYNNYDTDLFKPIMNQIEVLSNKSYTKADAKIKASFRVVADHIRSSTMLITDGIIPSNEGRGYVLRRIIRRAVKYLNELGVKEVSFYKLVPSVFEALGEEYSQNKENMALAKKLLELEERKFRETLELGLNFLSQAIETSEHKERKIFDGKLAFKLYDTYGLPLDLTEMYLEEKGWSIDKNAFDASMKEQKENSRKSWKGSFDQSDKVYFSIKEQHGANQFTGYTETETKKAKLIAIQQIADMTGLVFDKTPFYGEGGGQCGDTGVIKVDGATIANIVDTKKPIDGIYLHLTNEGQLFEIGQSYDLEVNRERRLEIMNNHSATHLLQAALIKILGPHVKQAGSQVQNDRLRFDFTHLEAMTSEEIKNVENLVNLEISKKISVSCQEMTMKEAIEEGATALFGEKYGNEVRTVRMGQFSYELCGGTHVKNTSDIGLFLILHETALASGVRRIEATTGIHAIHFLKHRSNTLKEIEIFLNDRDDKLLTKIKQSHVDIKELQKEKLKLQEQIEVSKAQNIFLNIQTSVTKNIPFLISEVDLNLDLKRLSDLFISKHQQGVVCFFSMDENQKKISFIIRRGADLKNINANLLIKNICEQINGKGGGRPELAQASAEYTPELSAEKFHHLVSKLIEPLI